MHWREYTDRLNNHKLRHERGQRIQDNWRLGACEICFPQTVGLGIEAGQFWDFFRVAVPEATYLTSKEQDKVGELIREVRNISGKPKSTDLTTLYNKAKAVILC